MNSRSHSPRTIRAGALPIARQIKNSLSPVVFVVIWSLLANLAYQPAVYAQAGEYPVKAAFLYHFAKFVDWPGNSFQEPNSRLVVGIVGDDPFGGVIDQALAGKNVEGHLMVVRRFRFGEDLKACHIIFVSSSERNRVKLILGSLAGSSILTIGETDDFIEQGGVIRLAIEANKVRFEINPDAADRMRLKISSKLLSLARVRGEHH